MQFTVPVQQQVLLTVLDAIYFDTLLVSTLCLFSPDASLLVICGSNTVKLKENHVPHPTHPKPTHIFKTKGMIILRALVLLKLAEV